MTDIDKRIDTHLSQLIDVTVEIFRAQSLLEAASLVIEGMSRPDLNALQITLDAADAELDAAKEKVEALCARCRSPNDNAEHNGLKH